MALLTAQRKFDTIVTGNRTEVCMKCAEKAGKRLIEARRDDKGKLSGKPVLRIDSERTICLECLKDMVNNYEATRSLEIGEYK